MSNEFSFRTRQETIEHLKNDVFDLLIIGGGITGAATARDAVSRGLKVALVEKNDFAFGTSSRSSKLIHGGLRYLENMEFRLVFEALSERSHLLKSSPYRVRPLTFYVANYKHDKKGRFLIGLGLWLYDILALFRIKHFHKRLSKKQILQDIPFLKHEDLRGGYCYCDASMWDDLLVIDTLRAAQNKGAQVANYVEALSPLWEGDKILGFKVCDREAASQSEFNIRAKRVVVCGGPWTDEIGKRLVSHWHSWLKPSKGVHLVFDLKRIPIPGALVMVHPQDGRVSFVMGRPDYGTGVTIVGTTDGPTPLDPEKAVVEQDDIKYLMDLLNRYFPKLNLSKADIISAYVGVRPLMGDEPKDAETKEESAVTSKESLQKVSREHFIGLGPGQVVLVAGGKYTTHRQMAKEIVDFTLKVWKHSETSEGFDALPNLNPGNTDAPANPSATPVAVAAMIKQATEQGLNIPHELVELYGADALEVYWLSQLKTFSSDVKSLEDPLGFPFLKAQLIYSIRHEMVLHLEDFYIRRTALFLARSDHGLPWAKELSEIWAQENGLGEQEALKEYDRLIKEVDKRQFWKK